MTELPEIPEMPDPPAIPETPDPPEIPETPDPPELPKLPDPPELPKLPETFYLATVKRLLDIVGSALLLILTAPIQALCAAAIATEDGRPIYFGHPRVGQDGRPFKVHKLRTMTVGTDAAFGGYPPSAAVTRVGRFLRRWSLDELPQLVNILRGQMSFVGPRPAVPSQVERYTTRQRGRLSVRPGLTGLAQIQFRDSVPWSRRITSDLEYVRDLSFRLDLLVMLRTVPMVLGGQGHSDGHTAAQIDDLPGHDARSEPRP